MTVYLRAKSAGARDFPDSLGHLLGRTMTRRDAGSLAGDEQIIPRVIAWPYASDINGQAYPAGLVGVILATTLGVPVDPATVSGAVSTFPIPVPSVLPAGYAHRWERHHMLTPGSWDTSLGQGLLGPAAHDFTGVSATSDTHRIRMADGLHDYFATLPECRLNGSDSGPVSGLGSSTWSHVPITGWRYIQFATTWPDSPLDPGVKLTVEVRCNADGANGAPGHGDTLLASWVSVFARNTTDTSSVFTASLQFPLGIRRWVEIRNIVENYPNPGDIWESLIHHPFRIRIKAGARVDLPLHFTATGTGSLIAPGGIVTSKLDVPLPT